VNLLMLPCSNAKSSANGGARWPRGQCAELMIAETKQCSQRSVIGWVTKIYYLQLLRASEGMLSRWSWLHLQSLAPAPISRKVDAGRLRYCRSVNRHIFIIVMYLKNLIKRWKCLKLQDLMCVSTYF
jgi:hypothetical protein